jgi:Beta-lactamase
MMVKKFNCSLAAVFGMTASMVALSATAIAQQTSTRCLPPATDLGGKTNSHTRFLESNLLPAVVQAGTKPSTLAERMAAYNVPGISVAVVTNGKLDWARGWGVRDVDSCKPVTPDTAFQAASISKAVTAVVALRLAERGKINLDENVNRLLRSWQLPVDVALALQPGEYQFKLGSEDWKHADFGTSAGEAIAAGGSAVQLIQHGGNIRLSITKPATYRFAFRLAPDGKGSLVVTENVGKPQ